MTAPLVPCTSCERHVRVTDRACPFCEAPLRLTKVPRPTSPSGRLGSLATFTFRAAAIGALAGACSAEANDDDGSAGAAGKRQQPGGASGAAGTQGDGGAGSNDGGRSGGTFGGAPTFAGAPTDGGAVAIYRATPKG